MKNCLNHMKNWLKKRIERIIKPRYDEVVVLREVVSDIMEIAKSSYPKEFITLLSGEIKNNKLIVNGLVYQVFNPSKDSAFMHLNLPMISGVIGSVHSHPTPVNVPSKADLFFFNKRGYIHLIIGYPFRANNIAAYDSYGRKISFRIA